MRRAKPEAAGLQDELPLSAAYDGRGDDGLLLLHSCRKGMASTESIIVFPGGRASTDYHASIMIRSDLIDWHVVYGRKYVYVHACVIYQTFGEVRHTSVCYYAQAGRTLGSVPLCDKGNKAD
jgi:hypothetical protein